MKRKPYPISDVTGGLNVERLPIMLLDKESSDLTNVRFSEGVMKKDLGFSLFGSNLPLDGVPMFIDTFYRSDGSKSLLVVTNKWIYEYINGIYIKRNAIELTGSEDDSFDSTSILDSTGDDVYFLTNGIDPVMYWYGAGDFTASTFYARTLEVFKNRLFLGNTTEGGQDCTKRVRWSVIADPFDFAGAGAAFFDLVDTSDSITKLVALKDKLFALKERSIWEIFYVGGTTYFLPQLKLEGNGTLAKNSVALLGEGVVFFGTDNIYIYDGISLTGIGNQLYPILYNTEKKVINTPGLKRCSAIYQNELEEYWINLPTRGARTNLLLKYNFNYKSWVKRTIGVSVLGFSQIDSQRTWNNLIGSWGEQTWIWMETSLPVGAPTTLIGTPDGNVYQDDRSTKSSDLMRFETKDFKFAHAQRWTEFRIEVRGEAFTVSYSLDYGTTWSAPRSFSGADLYKTYTVYINETSKNIRARIESYAEDLDVKWIEPWYITRQNQPEVLSS